MKTTVGILLCTMFLGGTALAAEPIQLFKPRSINAVRDSALYHAQTALKLDYQATVGGKVKLVGYTPRKQCIMMVSLPGQRPVFVKYWKGRDAQGQSTQKVAVLTPADHQRLGILTPDQALQAASKNGGIFGKVSGETKIVGSGKKGYAYKLTVTPAETVIAGKGEYGHYEVSQSNPLTRYVNALGNGESASGKWVQTKSPVTTVPNPFR